MKTYKVFKNYQDLECVKMKEDWEGGKVRDVLAPDGDFTDVEALLATGKYSLVEKKESK